MKFLLPLIVTYFAAAPYADTSFIDAGPSKPVVQDPYVSLINFHEKEDLQFVNPISNEINQPVTYQEIRMQAILNCKNVKDISKINEDIIDDLIEIEKEFDVPEGLRGMLLAAACSESGYNATARGDHRFSKSKKKAMAHGILQMWPWWEKSRHGYGINRMDHKQAARAWMTHISKKLPKVKKICSFRTDQRNWVAAWVTAIRAPKHGGRCGEKPLHLAVLKKWHRLIRVDRDFSPGC